VLRANAGRGGVSITSIAFCGALLIATLVVPSIWSDERFSGAVSRGAKPLLLIAAIPAVVAAAVTFVQSRKRRHAAHE